MYTKVLKYIAPERISEIKTFNSWWGFFNVDISVFDSYSKTGIKIESYLHYKLHWYFKIKIIYITTKYFKWKFHRS